MCCVSLWSFWVGFDFDQEDTMVELWRERSRSARSFSPVIFYLVSLDYLFM